MDNDVSVEPTLLGNDDVLGERLRLSKEIAQYPRDSSINDMYITVSVLRPYLISIAEGKKTVEGRTNSGQLAEVKDGQLIMFHAEDAHLLARVLNTQAFPSFEQMLRTVSVDACLPSFEGGLSGAVELYRSFPDYIRKEREYGVLALFVQPLHCEELQQILESFSTKV